VIASKYEAQKNPSKGMTKWIGHKSKLFIYSALKSFIPKNRLKKTKHTFDLTLYDDIFEVLLKHTIIKLPGPKVI
jgi:hypothetical protein